MATRTDGRRGYAAGDARRERILHIAMQEFAENGYRGTSLARVAERAGLSQPGLLHHFRSKEQLLVAVLDLRDRRDAERFLGPDGAPPTGAAMLDALADLVEHNSRAPELVRLFAVLTSEAVTADHPARAWARDRYAHLRARVAESFAAGVAAGEFRAGIDADSYAVRVIALMDGLQTQWLLAPDEIDMPALFRAQVADILAALR